MVTLALLTAVVALLAAATGPLGSLPIPLAGDPERGPRLLLVDIDDIGFKLLADTPTPALDWMAARGRTFTSFTTSPLCSPTRAMMMTGAYPSHPDLLCGSIVRGRGDWSMPTAPLEPLPRVLGQFDVSSGKVGKWHLSNASDIDHPLRCGWQSYSGAISNLGGMDNTYYQYIKVENGVAFTAMGPYLTTDETDDAIDLVRAGVRFVSLSYHAAHAPFEKPPVRLHSIVPIANDRDRGRAMLQACDREFGRLLRVALAGGYTVVVFSDNGTSSGLGGGKGTVFDRGIVNPMWAIGPGVEPGVDGSLIGAVDIYATVLDFFGVPGFGSVPGEGSTATRGPQSRSFLEALAGRPVERRWTYSETFQFVGKDPRAGSGAWRRAVRGQRYKLIRRRIGLKDSFYDLLINPAETNNLLGSQSLSREARAALTEFRAVMDGL